MPRPLEGLKVLELARILAGPWAGQTLADLGADVVKIESPSGDDTRQWGPPFVAAADGGHLSAAYFHSCNRGKRSLVIDLGSAEGQEAVRRLASRADVVIDNFKVGTLARFGLDEASLKAVNPRLIHASISGFGQDGPYAGRAGYDFLIQAMGGAMSVTGEADGPPLKTGFAIADLFAGLYAVVAVLAALHRRGTSGEGARIDCALLDVQVAVLANQALNYLVSGEAPGRLGNGHPNIVPYDLFEAADGPLAIAVGNDSQFGRLCELLGMPAMAGDERFADNQARVRNRAELTALLNQATSRRSRDELLALLESAGVPAGPINSIDEVFADPQVRHREMRLDLPSAASAGASIPGVRTPLVIDGEAMAHPRPSPLLGEHGDYRKAATIWTNGD